MTGSWQPTPLDGVLLRRAARHEDPRGVLREVWRASWTTPLGVEHVVQVNHTTSRAGALRGMHFHLRQTDLWVVLDGRAFVGLADVREPLATGELSAPPQLSLTLETGDSLLIPIGVAHGLWALSEVSLLYFVSAEYDSSDEHGFGYADPAVDLPWPKDSPILSERDRKAPSLAEAIKRARA